MTEFLTISTASLGDLLDQVNLLTQRVTALESAVVEELNLVGSAELGIQAETNVNTPTWAKVPLTTVTTTPNWCQIVDGSAMLILNEAIIFADLSVKSSIEGTNVGWRLAGSSKHGSNHVGFRAGNKEAGDFTMARVSAGTFSLEGKAEGNNGTVKLVPTKSKLIILKLG